MRSKLMFLALLALAACSEPEPKSNDPKFYINVLGTKPAVISGPFGKRVKGCSMTVEVHTLTEIDAFTLKSFRLHFADIPREGASYGAVVFGKGTSDVKIGAEAQRIKVPIVGDCSYYREPPHDAEFTGVDEEYDVKTWDFDIVIADMRNQ